MRDSNNDVLQCVAKNAARVVDAGAVVVYGGEDDENDFDSSDYARMSAFVRRRAIELFAVAVALPKLVDLRGVDATGDVKSASADDVAHNCKVTRDVMSAWVAASAYDDEDSARIVDSLASFVWPIAVVVRTRMGDHLAHAVSLVSNFVRADALRGDVRAFASRDSPLCVVQPANSALVAALLVVSVLGWYENGTFPGRLCPLTRTQMEAYTSHLRNVAHVEHIVDDLPDHVPGAPCEKMFARYVYDYDGAQRPRPRCLREAVVFALCAKNDAWIDVWKRKGWKYDRDTRVRLAKLRATDFAVSKVDAYAIVRRCVTRL